ncbi:MAG: ABC transporter permease [Cyclobacteriaceae bacterium]
MFRNYLTIAFRNLAKHQIYSFINVFGLAIGMAACLVIFLFVSDELSFDGFHQKKDRIYRLDEVQSFEGMSPQNVALSMPGMGPNLLLEMPEIADFTRFWNWDNMLYQQGVKELLVERTVMVDSTFLDIFDFRLLQGDAATALDAPNSVIMTEETAQKFFGRTDVLDESLVMNDEDYKVTGVLEDVPENSHLQFDALTSISTVTRENPEFNDRWGSNFMVTYLLLHPQTDIAQLESKFPQFLQSHMDEDVTNYYTLFLQPLTEVHLGSMGIEHDYQNYRKFDRTYIRVFSILAFFVLVIASINFMNLSVARSATRSKEVGIRKAVGAIRQQIIRQFLGESVLLTFLALALALLLTAFFIPYLNFLTNRSLSLLAVAEQGWMLLGIILVACLVGILSGAYPAFFLSSFQAAKVLKGRIESLSRKSMLRNGLVVVQFSIAIALIVGTVLAVQQLQFMKSKDIGFNKEQMMLIPMSREANEKYETLKNEIDRLNGTTGVTASGQRMGNNLHQTGAKMKTDTLMRELTVSQVNVDHDFLKVYGIPLKEGRDFSLEHSTDAGFGFIINQSLADELGLEDPVGARFGFGWYNDDTLGTIVGVTQDFNFNSLHHSVNTLCLHIHPEWGYSELSVKLSPAQMEQTIREIEGVWTSQVSDRPFEYSFLDEHFASLYRSDEQMSSIVSIIAGLAIIIACLGLFGLASITTEQRTKEIGIRKVLGASLSQLLVVLSRSFAVLVMLAFLISVPVSYFLLQEWLAGFAFRITIGSWVFLFAGVISFLVAMATISFQTMRAALANPVESLRTE